MAGTLPFAMALVDGAARRFEAALDDLLVAHDAPALEARWQVQLAEMAFRKPLRWGLFALGALRPARHRNSPGVSAVLPWM